MNTGKSTIYKWILTLNSGRLFSQSFKFQKCSPSGRKDIEISKQFLVLHCIILLICGGREEIIIFGVLLEPPFHWRSQDFRYSIFLFQWKYWGLQPEYRGIYLKSGFSNENLGSPTKIWGLQWTSGVSNKNLGSPMNIWSLQWKSEGMV